MSIQTAVEERKRVYDASMKALKDGDAAGYLPYVRAELMVILANLQEKKMDSHTVGGLKALVDINIRWLDRLISKIATESEDKNG